MNVTNVARFGGIVAAAVGLTAAGLMTLAQAQAPQPLKIGLLAGLSGVYGDLTQGELEAMQLAVEDVGGKVLGRPIEIVSADHQNKPDIASSIARKWYDEGVK